jgi:hypothetical protein
MTTAPSELPEPPAVPEDLERRWLRTVYRPGVPQLTVRTSGSSTSVCSLHGCMTGECSAR